MKNWTNRDWGWLTSILVGIIIIILTWRLNDNDNIVNIISMFASGASIILAVVAIVQSTIYNSSSNELNAKMTEKLSLLENNVEFVKENILNNANKIIERAPIDEDIKQEIKNDLSNSIEENRRNINTFFSEYVIEDLVYNRFVKVYGNTYDVKKINEGIVLKNNNKEIIIEIKTCTNRSLASMFKSIKNFELKNNNVNRILLLIIDNNRSRMTLNNNYTRLLSPNEILDSNDSEFKEKMKIEELS
ncbi:TPA: hypothetical protein ACF2DS_001166 [Clostridium perfringens]|uniref:hypothetical protein n=1 Tax=Clostridium perfringens TaxID=1502 RepID=UPI0018AA27A0|nr:hypothetical protein [Clostridium perfringens]EHR1327251.1 hypothetical protein [Clostridium perfringens]EHR1330384.1 hypothetical protein [Clostridium perfringens]EHR1423861.1 hypothetical protein [Clostridium perfringens]EIF6165528.1 hypothetical protein [Clostridium perfringens]MDU0865824.1 hypothetical protein [Clostridium perfringens]